MLTSGEIQVGDIGTLYQVPIYDDDLEEVTFDPSTAQEKKIHFRMPSPTGHVTLERTADAAQVTINGASVWCLTYTVTTDDAATFHITPGLMSVQGYVQYADGRKWHSNIITKDNQGRPLKIYPNL